LNAHGGGEPSAWVRRFAAALPTGATVLDVACGRGRHARFLADRGCRVLAVDLDREALVTFADRVRITAVQADLEHAAFPVRGAFDAVVVVDYLWRPLSRALVESVATNGWLLHETFLVGQERIGRPRNPDFLLKPGELLELVAPLTVVAFEQGFDTERGAYRQRVAAVRAPAGAVALPSGTRDTQP
jgi:SAM-dependent methyltransferase